MTAETKELIKALRCSATPGANHNCEVCKYGLFEEYDEKLPVPFDIEINGVKYYKSCDCDRMVLDAADLIENNFLEL